MLIRDWSSDVCSSDLRGGPRARHAGGQWGHPVARLQRVLRRDEPPDLVETQPPERLDADMAVAAVRRIERSTEKPDPSGLATGTVHGQPRRPVGDGGYGRTCPAKRNTCS